MPRQPRRSPAPAAPQPIVGKAPTIFRRAHCPVCGHQVGLVRKTVPGQPHLTLEYENPWDSPRPGVNGKRPFGIILESVGRGTIRVVGYYDPQDGDPEGFFPRVRARLIEAVQDWLSKGYLSLDDFGVPPPTPLPIAPSPPAPAPPAPPRAPATAPLMPMPEFPLEGGLRPARALIKHLQALEVLPQDTHEMEKEYERLGEVVEEWLDAFQARLDEEEDRDRPNEARLERLQDQIDALQEVVDALGNQDAPGAQGALERAYPPAPPKKPREEGVSSVDRLEAMARAFIPRIEALKTTHDAAALNELEQELLKLYDDVVDQIERVKGQDKARLETLAQRLETGSAAIGEAVQAFNRRDLRGWARGLDKLKVCCT